MKSYKVSIAKGGSEYERFEVQARSRDAGIAEAARECEKRGGLRIVHFSQKRR